jgi:hypothetical protein
MFVIQLIKARNHYFPTVLFRIVSPHRFSTLSRTVIPNTVVCSHTLSNFQTPFCLISSSPFTFSRTSRRAPWNENRGMRRQFEAGESREHFMTMLFFYSFVYSAFVSEVGPKDFVPIS